MRLDGVEIKVTLAGDQTQSALRALGLPSDRPAWRIYFCEDVAVGAAPGTPLLDLGVILRARDKSRGEADTTVKLRPCRRSQLTGDWLNTRKDDLDKRDDWEFKVEADWSGERRVLAASCSAERGEGVVRDAGSESSVKELFRAKQVDFLHDCADVHVNLDALTVLPAVTASRWKDVEAAPPELGVRAERWTVDHLDFLELSVVADIDDAHARQAALARFVTSLDLAVDQGQQSKTKQVLRHLVALVTEP
jgi:hypothetical protein